MVFRHSPVKQTRYSLHAAYFVIAALALSFAVVFVFSSGLVFRRFLGETNPIFVVGVAAVVGTPACRIYRRAR